MQLNILTPEQKVFTGEAESVQLCGTDGKFEILNNHAPMIASYEGTVKIKTSSGKQNSNKKAALLKVLKNSVSVLTEGIAE
ncbi:MAG: hypothetical protein U0T77_11865 [Chitinophagales bacterium]